MPLGFGSLSGTLVYATGTLGVLGSDRYSSGASSQQHANVWNLNVTNSITTKLTKIEDFLACKTQFTAFLITHKCHGFIDSRVPPPTTTMLDVIGSVVLNPAYNLWLRYD